MKHFFVAETGEVPDSHKTAFAVTLMENLVVPTFVLDADRRVMIWNRACERLTGIPAGAVVGTRDHWRAFYDHPRPCLADLVASGDSEQIARLYSAHEEPGAPPLGVHAENWCQMPQRKRRLYLAVDAGPVYDEAGKLLAVVETLRDITEKKLTQAKVQEQADLLQAHFEEHQREADLARRILQHQVREDLMREAGVRYAIRPASNFSGDMVLAARSPDGRLYALLADATGHGLAAAVSVLPIVQEFYRLVEANQPLSAVVEAINFMLAKSMPLGRFVAAACVCLDEAQRQGSLWVGGVPEVLLVGAAGRILRHFPSRHLPLGVSRDPAELASVETFSWEAPCRLAMLSDGVLEASNARGEAFGEAGLLAAFARAGDGCPLEQLHAALNDHLAGLPAHDDMSLLIIDCPA